MTGKPTAAASNVVEWMVDAALASAPIDETFARLVRALRDEGFEIDRGYLAHPTLHPLHHGAAVKWTVEAGLSRETFAGDSEEADDGWSESPVRYAIANRVRRLRRRLAGPGATRDFPLLEVFAADGFTDYVLLTARFEGFRSAVAKPDHDIDGSGVVCTFATRRAGGFSDEEIETLQWLLKPLAIVVKMADQRQVALNLAECYIGREAEPRVLGGAIRRGDFASTRAVVWLSDLRASTELSRSSPREDFIDSINEFFDCTAGAVEAEDGEPLTFIGDAVLAIFPIERMGEAGARRAAIRAADRATAALDELNVRRVAQGRAALRCGLALHAGVLEYGNIGSPSRHSWSVIGPVVNETARLEDVTKTLGEPVIASRAFVDGLPRGVAPWRSMGALDLPSVPEAFEVFAPAVVAAAERETA